MDCVDLSAGDAHVEVAKDDDEQQELSIYVSESEEALFPGSESKSLKQNSETNLPGATGDNLPNQNGLSEQPEDLAEDEEESIETSELFDQDDVETITSDGTQTEVPIEDQPLKQESMFHCVLCGNKYNEPKILYCMHTFCYNCIDSRKEEHHKYIFCYICKTRSVIPQGGIHYLQTNVVIQNMIAVQNTVGKASSCVVCSLRDEEKPATGQCVDCGDDLCADCCEKHTYSRQTATHIVISLSELMSEMNSKHLRGKQGMSCDQHSGEELKFYCEGCATAVCRDCVLLKHGGHSCLPLSEVYEAKKKEVETALENHQRSSIVYEGGYDGYLERLNIAEGKEIEEIETTERSVISSVEKMFETYKNELHAGFDKLRDVCLEKQRKAADLEEIMTDTTELVNFYLKEACDVEFIALQKVISKKLNNDKFYNELLRKQTIGQVFPKVKVKNDSSTQLEKMNFCDIVLDDQKPSSSSQRGHQRTPKHQNANTGKSALMSFAALTQTSPQSVGRGSLLKQHFNSNSPMEAKPFPLGNVHNQRKRPGQNISGQGGSYPTTIQQIRNQPGILGNPNSIPSLQSLCIQPSNMSDHQTKYGPQGHSVSRCLNGGQSGGYSDSQRRNVGNGAQQTGRKSFKQTPQSKMLSGQKFIRMNIIREDPDAHSRTSDQRSLKLKQIINAKVMQDQNEPDITGITFTSEQSFAVSDRRNSKIKFFSIFDRKFLQYFTENNPMSLTFCEGHLVWNKDNQTVCVKSVMSNNKNIQWRMFVEGSTHPVTTFNGTKYLVANASMGGGGPKVVAFQVSGEKVHSMEVRDSRGVVLEAVTDIAAHRTDQVVLLQHDRVIVNDFDGNCKGEYSGPSEPDSPRWSPRNVCIDEKNNIWVTDSARNNIVLLDSTGGFLQEWLVDQERPSCIAVNHAGTMLVTGVDRSVGVYQYGY